MVRVDERKGRIQSGKTLAREQHIASREDVMRRVPRRELGHRVTRCVRGIEVAAFADVEGMQPGSAGRRSPLTHGLEDHGARAARGHAQFDRHRRADFKNQVMEESRIVLRDHPAAPFGSPVHEPALRLFLLLRRDRHSLLSA